jgi:hypothetical protein
MLIEGVSTLIAGIAGVAFVGLVCGSPGNTMEGVEEWVGA